ncbi:hypothetical protein JQX08_14080 [Pseudomonas sp. UL073]|uniref:Uncharacterized protein n=1 Tax=Zestomonas insulae TaxID=2809017 RepID=A0ABS2IFG7_9GAMM|nr:hypothetical protein [Pseudomonas insulae]MBM7061834.1 hypothetical protein [Pseudomonas insulae]
MSHLSHYDVPPPYSADLFASEPGLLPGEPAEDEVVENCEATEELRAKLAIRDLFD